MALADCMAVFGMYDINILLYTYPMYLSILIAISMIQAVVSNVFMYSRLFIYINWSFYYIFSVFLKHRVGDLVPLYGDTEQLM